MAAIQAESGSLPTHFDWKRTFLNHKLQKPRTNDQIRGKNAKKLLKPPKSEKTKADVFRSREKLQSFKGTFASAKVLSVHRS
ncbi:hypothetical protein D2910_07225 [Planomicrobium okeanokoites]|nr:hypothetical protein D2910_07225 [Planomicrobium okeanokoites]